MACATMDFAPDKHLLPLAAQILLPLFGRLLLEGHRHIAQPHENQAINGGIGECTAARGGAGG
jgi:hypothetical protein